MFRTLVGLAKLIFFGNTAVYVFARLAARLEMGEVVLYMLIFTGLCLTIPALAGLAELTPSLRQGGAVYATIVGAGLGAAVGAALGEIKARSGTPEAGQVKAAEQSILASEDLEEWQAATAPRLGPIMLRQKLVDVMVIMALRYHNGQAITRKACQESGVCNQTIWNIANHLLGLLELRVDQVWYSRGDEREDIRWIRTRVKVITAAGVDDVWVRRSNSDEWEEVNLTKWLK